MNDRHQKTSYPLRMPDDLRNALEQVAKQENRSLHAEIIKRLEESFDIAPPLFTSADALDLILTVLERRNDDVFKETIESLKNLTTVPAKEIRSAPDTAAATRNPIRDSRKPTRPRIVKPARATQGSDDK